MSKTGLVFNSYVYNILLSQKQSIYDSINFDVWFCHKINIDNNCNLKLWNFPFFSEQAGNTGANFDIDKIGAIYLGNLGSLTLENVSKEDGLPPSGNYQDENWLNIPASAYIFSNYSNLHNTNLTVDDNFYADTVNHDYYVEDSFSKPTNIKPTTLVANKANNFNVSGINSSEKEYFESEYSFSSGYDINEYRIYNVNLKPLIESQTNFKSTNSEFLISPTNYDGGALLISWYNDTRTKLYNYDGKLYYPGVKYTPGTEDYDKNEKFKIPTYNAFPVYYWQAIPCCYFNLPKNYSLKDTEINIRWSENGIFSFM